MKNKVLAIIILSIICLGHFSFAEEEDFPVALKITNNMHLQSENNIEYYE